MKILVALILGLNTAYATEVLMWMSGHKGDVDPGTTINAKLIMTGADKVRISINGAPQVAISWPYEFSYVAKPAGEQNTVIVTYCNFAGVELTDTFTTESKIRLYPKAILR